MYAYCGNNPIVFPDPSGMRREFYRTHEFGGKKVQERGMTSSVGFSANVALGPWTYSGALFLTQDIQGNLALQGTGSGGMFVDSAPLGFSASAAPFVMVTNAANYSKLEDFGVQIGGGAGGLNVDYVIGCNEDTREATFTGFLFGAGPLIPNFHVMWGETYTFFSTPSGVEFWQMINSYQTYGVIP